MALERRWPVVPPQLFTANGSLFGLVTLADTAGFKVKQSAYLLNTAGQTLPVQIKRVISPTQLIVGAEDNRLSSWTPLDITFWTVISGASIGAQEQDKNNIPWEDHYKAIYEADPTVADRVVFVDKYGQFYDLNNPLPISFDGTVQVGDVSIVDPSSGNKVKVNNDGSINVVVENSGFTTTVVNTYNEVVAIPSGATTQLVSYTVPAGIQSAIQIGSVSGENIARYDLLVNNVPQDTLRTYFGGPLNATFDFRSGNTTGLTLNAGDVVKIQVLHNRPDTATFEARIQVLETTL